MRSYQHHLGDWAAHTAALPWMEKAAYHLMIQAYYLTERPLPGNLNLLYRLLPAVTTREREAVRNVLQQFFTLESDGNYHQKRCDEELRQHGKFREGQKAKIEKRWEGRKTEKAIENSKAILGQFTNGQQFNSGRSKQELVDNFPGTHGDDMRLTKDTAGIPAELPPVIPNRIPYSSNSYEQTPVNAKTCAAAAGVCREKGFEVKAGNAQLAALIGDGATANDFAAAAALAAGQGKPWAFVVGIVRNRLSDATRMAQEGPKSAPGSPNYPMLPRWHDPR
jgi:uncharacterized protein YdaU (DUF1376 family)